MIDQQEHQSATGIDADALTVTILTAVERQLTKYLSTMAQQVDAVRVTAEQSRDELKAELAELTTRSERAAESQKEANDSYQTALQTALEERLAEFANHQHWRMNDLEDKVSTLETKPSGLDPEVEIELRQTIRDDIATLFQPVTGRIDDLTNLTRRFDEQSSALVQHVNETTAALTQRMDEGDQRMGLAIEDRFNDEHNAVQEALGEVVRKQVEHTEMLTQKIDGAESRGTDRLLALETRINEDQGTKIANLEATLGRIGSGFDEAMVTLSRRVVELENHLLEVDERMNTLTERLGKVDENAFEDLKQQMSSAIGEAMLVRIELDRVVSASDEKFDRQAIRLSEIEAKLEDAMDVDAAVQLERLEELERAVIELDPDQFVRKSELGDVSSGAGGSSNADATGGYPRTSPPSMTLNPRLPGADSSEQFGAAAPTADYSQF